MSKRSRTEGAEGGTLSSDDKDVGHLVYECVEERVEWSGVEKKKQKKRKGTVQGK